MKYKKILIAPDKFKGTLSAKEFTDIAEEAIKLVDKDVCITKLPLADGGEGSLDCFVASNNAIIYTEKFCDSNFRYKKASYAMSGDTAFIEMWQTCGLSKTKDKNPMITTTFGVGEQINSAIKNGAKKIIIGIGGSSTNDAGCGMACALGYNFYKENGSTFIPVGWNLNQIYRIEKPKRVLDCQFIMLNDVNNVLYGKDGASYVYAIQKGAQPEELSILDKGLEHFNSLTKKDGHDYSFVKGAGAAGGMGAGLLYFLNATALSGAEYFINLIKEDIHSFDLIITGEGSIDSQTINGKLIYKLYDYAHVSNFVAFCGVSQIDNSPFEIIEINSENKSLKLNLRNTKNNLKLAVINFMLKELDY